MRIKTARILAIISCLKMFSAPTGSFDLKQEKQPYRLVEFNELPKNVQDSIGPGKNAIETERHGRKFYYTLGRGSVFYVHQDQNAERLRDNIETLANMLKKYKLSDILNLHLNDDPEYKPQETISDAYLHTH